MLSFHELCVGSVNLDRSLFSGNHFRASAHTLFLHWPNSSSSIFFLFNWFTEPYCLTYFFCVFLPHASTKLQYHQGPSSLQLYFSLKQESMCLHLQYCGSLPANPVMSIKDCTTYRINAVLVNRGYRPVAWVISPLESPHFGLSSEHWPWLRHVVLLCLLYFFLPLYCL